MDWHHDPLVDDEAPVGQLLATLPLEAFVEDAPLRLWLTTGDGVELCGTWDGGSYIQVRRTGAQRSCLALDLWDDDAGRLRPQTYPDLLAEFRGWADQLSGDEMRRMLP